MEHTDEQNPAAEEPLEVSRFPVNDRSEIRAYLQSWNGKTLAHIRRWDTPKNGGDAYPAKKGLSVDPDHLLELLKCVALLMVAFEEQHV
jgi:hypothetical protein